jgi:hypothetical protein
MYDTCGWKNGLSNERIDISQVGKNLFSLQEMKWAEKTTEHVVNVNVTDGLLFLQYF